MGDSVYHLRCASDEGSDINEVVNGDCYGDRGTHLTVRGGDRHGIGVLCVSVECALGSELPGGADDVKGVGIRAAEGIGERSRVVINSGEGVADVYTRRRIFVYGTRGR